MRTIKSAITLLCASLAAGAVMISAMPADVATPANQAQQPAFAAKSNSVKKTKQQGTKKAKKSSRKKKATKA